MDLFELMIEFFIPAALVLASYFILSLDIHVAKNKKDLFFAIFTLSLCVIAASIADSRYSSFEFPTYERIVLNVICHILRPVIVLLFIRLVESKIKLFFALSVLAVFNAFIYCTAFVNGFAFSVDESNNIRNGPLALFSTILTAFYLFLLIVFSFRRFNSKKSHSGILVIYAAAVIIIAAIFDTQTERYTLSNTAIVIAALLYYMYLHIHYVNKTFYEQEEKLRLQQIALHVSQLQPHFLYNSLNTIYYLCEKDPETAQEAISKFSDYLRQNLDSLTNTELVTFSQELEHTDTYIWMEKLRFDDRLDIVYDIQSIDFELPVLSLQPIVENAVKHGICANPDGGTVTIASKEDDECYEITVTDNGVGFDREAELDPAVSHTGIKNVAGRLEGMCSGTLEITSKPGEGTKAVIRIPKAKEDKSAESKKHARRLKA